MLIMNVTQLMMSMRKITKMKKLTTMTMMESDDSNINDDGDGDNERSILTTTSYCAFEEAFATLE